MTPVAQPPRNRSEAGEVFFLIGAPASVALGLFLLWAYIIAPGMREAMPVDARADAYAGWVGHLDGVLEFALGVSGYSAAALACISVVLVAWTTSTIVLLSADPERAWRLVRHVAGGWAVTAALMFSVSLLWFETVLDRYVAYELGDHRSDGGYPWLQACFCMALISFTSGLYAFQWRRCSLRSRAASRRRETRV